MDGTSQLVVFSLDDQNYALSLAAVDRVARMVHVTPLPKAPEIIAGVVNVQGRIVPVVNVRRRFRLPDRPDPSLTDRLVIAHTTRRPVALVADAVAGVLEYPETEIVETEQVVPDAGYIGGIAKFKDGLILIHDLDKFLSLDEEGQLDRALSSA